MSDMPRMGSEDNPVRLDPFQRIVEVGWGGGEGVVILELEGETSNFTKVWTNDIPWDFDAIQGGLEGGVDWLWIDDHWHGVPFEMLMQGGYNQALFNHRMLPAGFGGSGGYSLPVWEDGAVLGPTGDLTLDLSSFDKSNYQNYHAIVFPTTQKHVGDFEVTGSFTSITVNFAVSYDQTNTNGGQAVDDYWSPQLGYGPSHNIIGGCFVWELEPIEFSSGATVNVYTPKKKTLWPIVCDYYGRPTDQAGPSAQHANWTHDANILQCVDSEGKIVLGSLSGSGEPVLSTDPNCILEWDWTDMGPLGGVLPNSCMYWTTEYQQDPVTLQLHKVSMLINMAKHSDGRRYLKTFRVINNHYPDLKWKARYYPPGVHIRLEGDNIGVYQSDLTTVVDPRKVVEGVITEHHGMTQNFTSSGASSKIAYDAYTPWPTSIPILTATG